MAHPPFSILHSHARFYSGSTMYSVQFKQCFNLLMVVSFSSAASTIDFEQNSELTRASPETVVVIVVFSSLYTEPPEPFFFRTSCIVSLLLEMMHVVT